MTDFSGNCPHGNINCSECMRASSEREWKRRALAAEFDLGVTSRVCAQAEVERDAARLLVEDLMKAEAKLREALKESIEAMGQVPIVRRAGEPPFSTCLGCGMVDGANCEMDCWVYWLEGAVAQAKAALAAKGIAT